MFVRFLTIVSISETIASKFFLISPSQILMTRQPSVSSNLVLILSRLILPLIFGIQYVAFVPSASFLFRIFQFRPCQKSPSQNIARRFLAKTMSGLPGSVLTFFLNRRPQFHRPLLSNSSGCVSLREFRFFIREANSVAGVRPL